MRTRALLAGGLLALAAALGSPALAQTGSVEILGVDASAAPEVAVTVAVPGVAGLDADSFTVSAAGTEVPVTASERRTDLDVALVVDSSGSMRGASLDAVKAAAAEFLQRVDPAVRVAVIDFATEARVLTGLDAGRDEALAAIGSLEADGRTALWDALVMAAGLGGDRPLTVVVVADGEDNASAATREEAVARLADRDADLHIVFLSTQVADAEALAAAAGSGGRFVDVADPAGLGPVYDALAERLSSQWTLSFTAPAGGVQTVEVAVAAGDEVLVTGSTPTSAKW
jgi:Mg-chelatase subunit ChlD